MFAQKQSNPIGKLDEATYFFPEIFQGKAGTRRFFLIGGFFGSILRYPLVGLFPGLGHLSFRHLSGHEIFSFVGSFFGIRMIAAFGNAKPFVRLHEILCYSSTGFVRIRHEALRYDIILLRRFQDLALCRVDPLRVLAD